MEEQTEHKGEQKNPMIKKLILAAAALVLLGGGAYWAVSSGALDLGGMPGGTAPSGDIVARVNGEALQASLYDLRVAQVESSYKAQGITLEGEQDKELLHDQVLEDMIDEMLLVQHGEEQGIEVTEEDIETEYQAISGYFGGQEEFEQQMAALGASQEDVRLVIAQELMLQRVADQQLQENDIQVSDEEVRQVYDDAAAGEGEVPPYEEVQDVIEQQLRQEKVGQIMNQLAEQLRAEGTIEILG